MLISISKLDPLLSKIKTYSEKSTLNNFWNSAWINSLFSRDCISAAARRFLPIIFDILKRLEYGDSESSSQGGNWQIFWDETLSPLGVAELKLCSRIGIGEIRFGVSLGDNIGLQIESFLDVERGNCLWVRERSIHPIDSSDLFC